MPRHITPEALGAELRAAVLSLDGVTVEDRPSYYIVRRGSTTLGYVNGKKKFRVDLPVRGGKREKMLITNRREIQKAVKAMSSQTDRKQVSRA